MLINIGLFAAYILIALCALAAILMPLAKAMGDPQSLKKMVMGVGVLVVVFVIGYLVADNTVYEKASAGTSRMVGAGLITMYILAFLAIGGILFTEVQKMFK